MVSLREQTTEEEEPALTNCASKKTPHTLNDLKRLPQWVYWRYVYEPGREKPRKVPISVHTLREASTTNPDTWGDLHYLLLTLDKLDFDGIDKVDGVGFVFTADDPYVGIDLDNCLDLETGEINEQARYIVQRFDSYTEITPSRRGLHIIVQGSLPFDAHRNDKQHVEIYDQARFFTFTFKQYPGTPDMIFDRQELLGPFQRRYLNVSSLVPARRATKDCKLVNNKLTDQKIIELVSEKEPGLWFGQVAKVDGDGVSLHSHLDHALCKLLNFYTSNDFGRTADLFRQSGLFRPEKWPRNNQGYLDKTATRARNGVVFGSKVGR